MRYLTFLLLFLPCTFSLNILMYVHVIGKSHLQYAEKIITLLNERGHNVDLVLGMFNSHVTLTGSYGAQNVVHVHFPGQSPWGAVAHLNNPFVEKSDWDRIIQGQSAKFLDTCHQLCDLLLDSKEVADLLTSHHYDMALINGYDFCPFALAHHHKISPVVSYVPTPAYYFQWYNGGIPELPLYENILFDARHADRSSFATRLFETFRSYRERYIHHSAYVAMNSKIRARFGDDFTDVQEIAMNISLDFTNSHPLLEEPRPTSLRLRYIGGVGLSQPKPLTKDMDEMLNRSKKGNVIFSFGTQIGPEKISAELRQLLINTFKRFPDYNFLWKLDGKTVINASNIFNMDWLPQTDLLHDSRVVAFISHMGLNSFTETAFAGVPVVAVPMFTDQVHNARRARALGMAEVVRKTEITEENLVNALQKVLFDDSYRSRAKEVSAMIAAHPDTPQRIFIEGIEFAAKFKNLSFHYRLAGASHNCFVQMGWDVAAFFTFVLFCIVCGVSKMVYFVVRLWRGKLQGKSKSE